MQRPQRLVCLLAFIKHFQYSHLSFDSQSDFIFVEIVRVTLMKKMHLPQDVHIFSVKQLENWMDKPISMQLSIRDRATWHITKRINASESHYNQQQSL